MSSLSNRIGGMRTSLAIKAPVRCATTSNIALTGFQTIDGVTLAAGDTNLRVLVMNQTDASENGIYDVKATAWTRAKDFNGSGDIIKGSTVLVVEGDIYSGNWFYVSTDDPIVIGTTDIELTPLESRAMYGITDVASAATCNIGATSTTLVRVTGTTTISSFGTVANRMRMVYFDEDLTITNSASLVLPNATDASVYGGDFGLFVSDASGNWTCWFLPALNTAPVIRAIATGTGVSKRLISLGNSSLKFDGTNSTYRTYFDEWGMLNTQGWMNISGVYNLSTNGDIVVVPAGAYRARPDLVPYNEIALTGGMVTISNDVIGTNLTFQDNGVRDGTECASNVTIVTPGTGYVVGDILTVSGGTISTAATGSVYVVTDGGTGYAVNDTIVLAGGDPVTAGPPGSRAIVTVTAVSGGVITSASLTTQGTYTRYPANSSEATQLTTSGGGSGARFAIRWPRDGATKIAVTEVDTGGEILAVDVPIVGRYAFGASPSSTVSVTGGTGTGATFAIDWSDKGIRSRNIDALNSSSLPLFSLEGDGTLIWGDGYDSSRQQFVRRPTTLGWYDIETLRTKGRLRTDRGLSAPIGAKHALGARRLYSATRTMTTGTADTVELGRVKLSGGATLLRVTAVSSASAVEWLVPHVWQGALNIEGGASLSTNWAEAQTVYDLTQAAQPTFTLDVKQSTVTGDLTMRLRSTSTAGASYTIDVAIEFVAGPTLETAAGVTNPTRRFIESSATATGVTPPTRVWPGASRSRVRREAYQYATPATGDTVVVSEGYARLLNNPAGALANLTNQLPTSAQDGQLVTLSTTQAITTFAVTASGAAVTGGSVGALAQYASVEFLYRLTGAVWWRVR